MKLLGFWQNKK